MHYIMHEDKRIGEFELTPLPGNSKMCVSHGLKIYEEFRGKGHGKRAQQERLILAKSLGFKVMMATVLGNNSRQDKILTGAGWKRVTFYEKPDAEHVTLWVRNLCDPYEEAQGQNMGCR